MEEDREEIRTWFKEDSKQLHFPAWSYTVGQIQTMQIAGIVLVNGMKYKIKEMVFDTDGDAAVFELVKADDED